jgi:hypothetical protein
MTESLLNPQIISGPRPPPYRRGVNSGIMGMRSALLKNCHFLLAGTERMF